MNTCRLYPCQAGCNGPVGIMREHDAEEETDGGSKKDRLKKKERKKVIKELKVQKVSRQQGGA